MNRRAWLHFGYYFAVNFLFTLLVAYLTSLVIDYRARGDQQIDSTVASMHIAGILAPLVLAPISGWKAWRPGPFYFATTLSSGLFTGNIGYGIVIGGIASAMYLIGRKVREAITFYFPKQDGELEVSPDEFAKSNKPRHGNPS